MNILNLLQQDGITTKKVSGTNGGEHSSPCPTCAGIDRFRSWPAQNEGGSWWCRNCDKGGDIIQYLREFRGMSYPEACTFLGREPSSCWTPLRQSKPRNQTRQDWTPRETLTPGELWLLKAEELVSGAQERLSSNADVKTWLHDKRGLKAETITTARLGWIQGPLFRERKQWGLPEQPKDDGKSKKLWIPAGLVIPCLDPSGTVQRVKIRRPEGEPRYYALPGSSMGPMILGRGCLDFMVVESELDAILLHQEAGQDLTVIALGSSSARPDKATAEILKGARSILVSLDSDEAGAKSAWQWWAETFPQSKRWPVIRGKDPCEAWAKGLDLRLWVSSGLPSPDEGQVMASTGPVKEDHGPPLNDDEDLFQCLIENIRAGGFWASHFDAARNYLKRTLPGELFEQLRREVDQ